MKSFVVYSLSLAALLSLSACSTDKIPGVYRIDVQQGNNVSQDMINQLEPGMSKNQVAFVMGTPLLIDTFHPNRWDYLYSYQPGGKDREQRRLTLYFNEDETLSHIEGDTRIVAREDLPQTEKQDKNVVVPLSEQKTGFFNGLMSFIGLADDETVEIIEEKNAEAEADDEAKAEANKAMMEEAEAGMEQPAETDVDSEQ
ncbi:outer membrane protein assembly factor BamE [uncultured Methylophaga sp.]|jgi:outer membrane protein assembly factor BamE|uniref:outer membrane protein assembly factor BamE n=1 Tax=uncultured Methylophaga sp. TaxID=285271 RepID=UPI002608EF5F|nr:outer membrane protein assembly factor BamE [uncultured Methylophaga sp.]